MINEIAEDFKKIVAVAKLKELKRDAKNRGTEKHTIKDKTDKKLKTTWNNVLLLVQRLYSKFSVQEVKMTNKVLREKSHCVVYRLTKSRFLKQKIN